MRYRLNFRDLGEAAQNPTRFHREAARLRKHLADCKPELVNLWGTIVTLPRGHGFTASMRIHLPTATLSAEGHGFTRMAAWNDVVNELEVRLERHNARLGGARTRARRGLERDRWNHLAMPPATNGDSVRAGIQAAYSELLDFLQAEVRLHEREGHLPRGAVDPAELADVVAMRALEEADAKPGGLSWEHWFLKLAYEQVLEAIDEVNRNRSLCFEAPALDTVLRRAEGPEGLVDEEDILTEWYLPAPRPRFGHDIPDPRSLR
ncbi:MAG: hypothetical protein JXQ29_16740 [Planctomycetes bacterium]|nr:hypothetical protein [Planctomycetota bacterium]